ncbi:MAG: hypothetical protein K0R14_970 [Burkholderiales bacterium]|jgi:hypothetical protein|nr:hypothetical protein [Burkholderiales bacterium]
MRKILCGLLLSTGSLAFADLTGLFVGGGLGYGMQGISAYGNSSTPGTPALKGFVGYQMADWVGAEAGYTYISQSGNWNGLGNPSSTIYDIAFTPGFSIPATPVTIYGRLGVDGVSSNLNSSWYNQIFSSITANFEWGLGVKVNIPTTRVFVRAEYINYGSATNNNNSGMSVTPSVLMINAAYVF